MGMDIHDLPKWLDLTANERANSVQPGLKIDTIGGEHQLENLILWSRQTNNNLRIAIKADKTTEYKSFDKVIEALQTMKVNRFNLITSAKTSKE
jgi:biopolymer transport protein ExbD